MLSIKLGLRFYLSKRYGPLARFMSLASTTGIALGVLVLILGLSTMNGFERELENRVLSVIPNASLYSSENSFKDASAIEKSILKSPNIISCAKALELDSVVYNNKDFIPVKIIGLDPKTENNVVAIERFMSSPLSSLYNKDDKSPYVNAIIGANIAKNLKLGIGSLFKGFASNTNTTNNSNNFLAQSLKFNLKVVGIVKIGGQLDSSFVYIDLKKALDIAKYQGPNVIHIKTKDILNARSDVLNAASHIIENAYLQTWLSTQGKLYNDIMMVRQIMYIAMFLVMAVACFNIVSNLIMTVTEKKREIAILLTMGTKRSVIVKAFCTLGFISGFIGTAIGTILGIVLSLSITKFTDFLKNSFNIVLLNEDIYFINFIPSKIVLTDIVCIIAIALTLSVLASIYPAFKASRTNIVSALNN